jgi:hypothetical protein
MARFLVRVVRAALLRPDAYEDVEADKHATWQAALVVVLSALALGVGNVGNTGASGILWSTLHGVVLWYVWALVTYFIGTRWLPTGATVADPGQLLRTIGFSSAPGILRILMLIPVLAGPVFTLCTVWMLVSMVVAVRQALDYCGTRRAIAVCAIGFPVYAVGLLVSVLLLGPWPV